MDHLLLLNNSRLPFKRPAGRTLGAARAAAWVKVLKTNAKLVLSNPGRHPHGSILPSRLARTKSSGIRDRLDTSGVDGATAEHVGGAAQPVAELEWGASTPTPQDDIAETEDGDLRLPPGWRS